MRYFLKKNLVALIVAVGLLIVPFIIGLIQDNSYEQDAFTFNSYKIDAKIESDGGMWVTETISAYFHPGTEGVIYRDVITTKNNNGQSSNTSTFVTEDAAMKIYNGSMSTLLYDSTTDYMSSGVKYVGYSWNNDRDDLGDYIRFPSHDYNGAKGETLFSYVPTEMYPERVYVFTYHYKGAVSTYKDVSELNWCFWSGSVKTKNVDVKISFPSSIENTDDIYFYGHASNGKLESITNNQVHFTIDKLLPSHLVESRIVFPTLGKDNVEARNYQDTNKLQYFIDVEDGIHRADVKARVVNIGILVVGAISILIMGGVFIFVYRKYDKELVSDFFGEYYRELPASYPPCEMGYLYHFKELTKDDLSATLMDLIRRKYIILDYSGESLTDKKPNYRMTLDTTKDLSALKEYEQYLLQWFFVKIGKDGRLTLDELDAYCKKVSNGEIYKNCNDQWVRLVKKSAAKNDFFDSAAEKGARKTGAFAGIFLVVGVIFAAVGLMFSEYYYGLYISGGMMAVAVALISYCSNVKRRSKNGNEEYVRWKAFKHFLTEFSHFEDYPMPSIQIWEHYLVYAVAFGIAELVDKQLRMKFKDRIPAEYTGSTFYRYNNFNTYFIVRMNRSYTSAAVSLNQARAAKASGGGGRGGFGGGSSFGGGGGGARGR